jgi:2-oxoisovalerate dehydrogenase E2 component (dihydrolipoyl transacylase)
MSELKEFRLPDVGEGLTEADIVRWHVQPGDKVTVNQVIVEIETAKAVVELPCPWDGVVKALLVPEGTTADVGTPIIAVAVGEDAAADVPAAPQGSTSADLVPPPPAASGAESAVAEADDQPMAVLVGSGVKPGSTTRRRRKGSAAAGPASSVNAAATAEPAAPDTAAKPAAPGTAAEPAARDTPAKPATSSGEPAAASAPGPRSAPAAEGSADAAGVLAKPPVRKLAKDLGVDLASLSGTGPGGSITRDDVQSAAGGQGPADQAVPVAAVAREDRIPVRGVRKHTADAVVGSAFTAPHVTEFLQIDMTEAMNATARLRALPEFAEIRVSPLLLVARALLLAVSRHPMINSSWDDAAQEIVIRHYVNLGIAAATDRGLIVPNIKDAHALPLAGLARALGELAETARAGKAAPADLRGGTITITNVGVFGVDYGTPILTPGEAAILAFGQVRDAPWVHEGQLAVRKVTTLALSFDHRIVDGDLGSAVLRDIGAMLEDPLRMLAWS